MRGLRRCSAPPVSFISSSANEFMRLREDKRKFDNPFKREAKVLGGLILLLGIIALAAVFFGPFVH